MRLCMRPGRLAAAAATPGTTSNRVWGHGCAALAHQLVLYAKTLPDCGGARALRSPTKSCCTPKRCLTVAGRARGRRRPATGRRCCRMGRTRARRRWRTRLRARRRTARPRRPTCARCCWPATSSWAPWWLARLAPLSTMSVLLPSKVLFTRQCLHPVSGQFAGSIPEAVALHAQCLSPLVFPLHVFATSSNPGSSRAGVRLPRQPMLQCVCE